MNLFLFIDDLPGSLSPWLEPRRGVATSPTATGCDQFTVCRREISEVQRIGHLLNRIAYGPTLADIERIQNIGINNYIEEQLRPETIDESDNIALIDALDSLTASDAPEYEDSVVIPRGSEWKYFSGTEEPPATWTDVGFDVTTWTAGSLPIGYGDGGEATLLSDMRGSYTSVYLRKEFDLHDASSIDAILIGFDHDDGFVAYLNGHEIVRSEMTGSPPPHSATASFSHEGGSSARIDKFLGRRPDGGIGSGFLGAYAGPQDEPGKPYRNELYRTGTLAAETVRILREANINPTFYQPVNGAQYPGNEFGTRLKICAQLLKETPVQILGVNLNGWDNHAEQEKHIETLMRDLAGGINALSKDLDDLWEDTVVMTMTEFGRTSIENGAFGTDHAYATVMFVAGGGVNGGVYNCDAATWQNGDIYSSGNGRYLAHRTDYRAVMAEIFKGHFGDSDAVVHQTIPDYATISAADEEFFTPLGLFA